MAKNMDVALLFDLYGDMLTDKQRDMVELYYGEDFSLSEIAENTGISRQGVRDSVKRAEAQLLEMEERLGLAKRLLDRRQGLAAIAESAAAIQEENESGARSAVIAENIRRILRTVERLAD